MNSAFFSCRDRVWRVSTPCVVIVLMLCAMGLRQAEAQKLVIDDGVVVKFGSDAGLVVHTALQTGRGTVLTSLTDDAVAGQTGSAPASAAAGDWRGVRVQRTVTAGELRIDGLKLRHANIALHSAGGVQALNGLDIADNLVGMAVSEAGVLDLREISLNRNAVALQADPGAAVSITGSDISGNVFGVLNLDVQQSLDAIGNWWGSVNGPTAPDNPAGDGDAVSRNVDYGQFLRALPLLDCSIATADGKYTVSLPQVQLVLACRNAVEYRLSSSSEFNNVPFLPMAKSVEFTLQLPPGEKQIHVQYRAVSGNTRTVSLPQPIIYSPGAPVVSILSPPENAQIDADTLIVARAAAAAGIERVEFHVGDQHIGTRHDEPFEMLWQIAGFQAGSHTLRVVAHSRAGESVEATRLVRVLSGNPDPSAPLIEHLRFGADPLNDGATLTMPGELSFSVSAPSGLETVEVQIDGVVQPGSLSAGRYAAWIDFASIANGPHTLSLRAVDTRGIETRRSLGIVVALDAPPAPVLTSPHDGETTPQPQVMVAGTAQPGSQVQIYLNDAAAGSRIDAGAEGVFSMVVSLPSEGTHRISADAQNTRGISPMSAEHWVGYMAADPEISFINPSEGMLIGADTELAVAIVDSAGIAQVHYSLDGQALATVTSPPWSWHWSIADVSDGHHTLMAQVTNVAGRTARAMAGVNIQRAQSVPDVLTPYVGELLSVAPATSHGEQPILIRGRAIERGAEVPAANATLHLVLETGGHQRKINVSTDAEGVFAYSFRPAATDAGVHRISVRHPQQADAAWQGQFSIERLSLNPTRYTLRAARTVPDTIRIKVTASPDTALSGLRFEATPLEQPSGSLPPGVQINVPEPINLAAGASRTLEIGFVADNSTPETGTVILVAYAQDSGSIPRGRVSVPFELSAPRPALIPDPISLLGGLAHGEQITLGTQLKNQGLLAAQAINVQLLNAEGAGPAPAWLHLSTPAHLETLPIGASWPIEVSASPGNTVNDGIHQARLRVTSGNAVGGDIPIAISVTRSGQGSVRFHAANIFTQTLDENGNPIPGLANVRIRLQHETIPTRVAEATTDAEGVAQISGLAAGRYLWRASAPDHADSSGRVHIQPGTLSTQDIFLDMELVNIDWEVIETTIPDEYQIIIGATYLTQVPAPVVLIEPIFVNLPALQAGEEYTGELTISNYGLVRAENVQFSPPTNDAYLHYEIIGEVPSTLEARERVRLSYKITALQSLATLKQVSFAGAKGLPEPLQPVIVLPDAKAGPSCRVYRNGTWLRYDYQCANGSTRGGSCGSAWGYTGGGLQCAGGGGSGGNGGGDGGGWGGGWGGGSSSGLPGAPSCTPNCVKCCTGGSWGGGGSGGGGPPPPGPSGGPMKP